MDSIDTANITKSFDNYLNNLRKFEQEQHTAINGNMPDIQHSLSNFYKAVTYEEIKKNNELTYDLVNMVLCNIPPEKTFFCYFLMRQIDNVPTFDEFLDAIFYVGKGTNDRPHDHFKFKKNATDFEKQEVINGLWEDDKFVIVYKAFESLYENNAFLLEYLIINGLKTREIRENKVTLTNKKSGNTIKYIVNWNESLKEKFSTSLLKKSYEIFKEQQENDRIKETSKVEFRYKPVRIKHKGTGMYLISNGEGELFVSGVTKSDYQKWMIRKQIDERCFSIKNVKTGFLLSNSGNKTTELISSVHEYLSTHELWDLNNDNDETKIINLETKIRLFYGRGIDNDLWILDSK